MDSQRSNDGLLRVVVIVLGILVLFPLLMMVFAMPMMGMMGWWWGDGMAGGLSPLWGLGMMLVWLVVLLGIGYLLYRGLIGGVRTRSGTDPALEELRLAYARGDLSEEEFEERRAKLRAEE
jgi:putative membrane protein